MVELLLVELVVSVVLVMHAVLATAYPNTPGFAVAQKFRSTREGKVDTKFYV